MEKPPEEFTNAEKLAFTLTFITVVAFQILACMTFSRLLYTGLITDFLVIFILDLIAFMLFIASGIGTGLVIRRMGKIKKYRIEAKDRGPIFAISMASMVGLFLLYLFLESIFYVNLGPLKVYLIAYFVVYIVDAIITLGFKYRTSMHMSGATCAITAIVVTRIFFYPLDPWFLSLFYLLEYLFLPIVAWCRWKVKGHTKPQLISGTIVALSSTITVYSITGLILFLI